MLKEIFLVFAIFSATMVSAQSGTGWTKVLKKTNYRDSIYFAKGIMFPDGSVLTGSPSSDSVIVSATPVTSGNFYLNSSDNRLHYKSNGYWYTVNISDSVATIPMDTDLISYWSLDEASGTLYDSQNDNDGTAYGATQNVAGKVGKAVSFDGVDDYVLIPYNSNLNITGSVSFSAWFYQSSSGENAILSRNYGSDVVPYILGISYGFPRLRYYSSAFVNRSDDEQVNTETWYHLVFTVSSAETKIYLNGTLVMTTDGIPSLPANTTSLYFGNYPYGSYYFTGIIDEIGIWSRVLSQADVTRLYNNGDGLAYPF